MVFKQRTDWNLLAKYMAGETNEKETGTVLSWAESNPRNKALLNDIKSDWKKMDSMDDRFDVDNAWEKLHEKITGEASGSGNETARPPRRIYFNMTVRIAASLLLLAILSVAVVSTTGLFLRMKVVTAQNEKGRVIDLPDGSRVYLNSGTEITYSKNFVKSSRDVRLNGEAFFEVAPDKEHPFRISAGNARVEVLGTSFNVNTRKGEGRVEVFVETGVVELYESGSAMNRVRLHPGNIGVVDQKEVSMSKAENANPVAWKTGAMTFEDTPLLEVISLLNNVYNVNITIRGEGADTIKINGSYQNDPLDNILQVISQHNPQLIIAKSEDTIYLSQ